MIPISTPHKAKNPLRTRSASKRSGGRDQANSAAKSMRTIPQNLLITNLKHIASFKEIVHAKSVSQMASPEVRESPNMKKSSSLKIPVTSPEFEDPAALLKMYSLPNHTNTSGSSNLNEPTASESTLAFNMPLELGKEGSELRRGLQNLGITPPSSADSILENLGLVWPMH